MAAGFGWPPFLHPIPYAVECPRRCDPVSCWDLLASGVLAPCLLVSQHLQMLQEALSLGGGVPAGSTGAALLFPLLFFSRGADAQALSLLRWCESRDCCRCLSWLLPQGLPSSLHGSSEPWQDTREDERKGFDSAMM